MKMTPPGDEIRDWLDRSGIKRQPDVQRRFLWAIDQLPG
jgi:hypothetical protein